MTCQMILNQLIANWFCYVQIQRFYSINKAVDDKDRTVNFCSHNDGKNVIQFYYLQTIYTPNSVFEFPLKFLGIFNYEDCTISFCSHNDGILCRCASFHYQKLTNPR